MPRLGFGLGLSDPWRGGVGLDFTGPVLPPGARFTRASAGAWTDAGGVLRTASIDVPRFDYGDDGGPRGLLIEPAATNFIPWATDLAEHWAVDAGGSGAAPVITPGAALAPDGSMAATRIDFVRGDGFSRLWTPAPGAAASGGCFSAWLRADVAGPSVALRVDGIDGGTLMLSPAWRRVALAVTSAPDANCQLLLWSTIANAPPTARVYAWGFQFESGSAPSSNIATQGASVSRAADQLSIDAARLGIADGPARLRLILDDGSAVLRDVVASGGRIAIAPDLPRPWLRRIERV